MNETLANAIGLLGTACIIFAYAYMTGKRDPNPFVQHGVNLLGAALLTVSLLYGPLGGHAHAIAVLLPSIFIATLVAWFTIPETAGKTLEQIAAEGEPHR